MNNYLFALKNRLAKYSHGLTAAQLASQSARQREKQQQCQRTFITSRAVRKRFIVDHTHPNIVLGQHIGPGLIVDPSAVNVTGDQRS